MTKKNAPAKKRTEPDKETFKSIVIEFFKQHGIKGPVSYLAKRAGRSRPHIYWILETAENGVGTKDDQFDPKNAYFFIQQAEEVLKDDEMFEPTTIEKYIRPLLDKFNAEQEKTKK